MNEKKQPLKKVFKIDVLINIKFKNRYSSK